MGKVKDKKGAREADVITAVKNLAEGRVLSEKYLELLKVTKHPNDIAGAASYINDVANLLNQAGRAGAFVSKEKAAPIRDKLFALVGSGLLDDITAFVMNNPAKGKEEIAGGYMDILSAISQLYIHLTGISDEDIAPFLDTVETANG